jgi:hypothetical protein
MELPPPNTGLGRDCLPFNTRGRCTAANGWLVTVLGLILMAAHLRAADPLVREGLLAFWPFQNGIVGTDGARALDSATPPALSIGLRSIRFDGGTNFLLSGPFGGYFNGREAFTLATWLRTDEPNRELQTVFAEGPNGPYLQMNILAGGKIRFSTWNVAHTPDNWMSLDTPPQDLTRWRFVVVTFSKTPGEARLGKCRIFVDGELMVEGAGQLPRYTEPRDSYLVFGSNPGPHLIDLDKDYRYFKGGLRSFYIFDRPLGDDEIRQLYTWESAVTFVPRPAVATAQLVNGFVVGATLIDAGFGYAEAPRISISGGGGSGATALSSIFDGSVSGIQLAQPGSGYLTQPSLEVAPPPMPARRALAVADVVNGFVVGVRIIERGHGYDRPPAVRILGGGGAGAIATAALNGTAVAGISMTSAGNGFTSTPTVVVASPPFTPRIDLEVSRVRLTLHVVLGFKYRIEGSRDLKEWVSVGDVFEAEAEVLTRDFDVTETGRYFRLVEVR